MLKQNDTVETRTSHKRILQGRVTSNKAEKTIVVAVERQVMHPLYKKYFKSTKKFMAHDEENACNIGDVVRIKEHRPLSANKRWILEGIVTRVK
jgi:small subunit ribosomal protein S17